MAKIRTPQELKQLAFDIVAGNVFTDRHIHARDMPRMLNSVFMVLSFMDQEAFDNFMALDPVIFFEDMHKASPGSVNGYPTFFSMQYLNKKDWDVVREHIKELQAYMKFDTTEEEKCTATS